jgi:hypothetical protein
MKYIRAGHGIQVSKALMPCIITRPPLLRLLICALCTIAGCANESGAVRLRQALDQEGNRLSLLSEDSATVELVPSTEPYWVAVVPDDKGSNLSRELPFTQREYERVCACASSGARILVGDSSGIKCVISTALDIDELRVVSKTKGDSVQIHLLHDAEGVHVVALY